MHSIAEKAGEGELVEAQSSAKQIFALPHTKTGTSSSSRSLGGPKDAVSYNK